MAKKIAKSYSIDNETYEEFEKLCEKNNLNKSKVISKQIKKFINERKNENENNNGYLLLD
jgi:metal-responsive CopG/Arc/MetJ family transcriptional regulator